MRKLENHLDLVCQLMEEEMSHFHLLIEKIRKETEYLRQISPDPFRKKKKNIRLEKEGSR